MPEPTRTGSRNEDADAVVVPAGTTGSALAVVRSLGRHGVRVVVAATEPRHPTFASRYCGESHIVPDPREDVSGYGDALLELARRPNVRTVVPLTEADAHVLSTRRDEFAEHVGTPWPGRERMTLAQDRCRLFERTAAAGVPMPDTSLVGDFDAWDDRYVVKPRYTVVVEDGRTRRLDAAVFEGGTEPSVDAFVAEMGHEPIAQRYVPSDGEFGFFALYDRGRPVRTFQHRRVRSYSYAGGASVYRESYRDPELARAGRRVLDALEWHGPAMVEFRRDARDGTYRLLEVNPRFWGSIPLAVAAGVDFPRAYWLLATDEPNGGVGPVAVDSEPPGATDGGVATDEYDAGVGCHALLGEGSYLLSVARDRYPHATPPSLARASVAVLVSLVAAPNFDVLSLSDPRPFAQLLERTARVVLPGDDRDGRSR
ncbi:carboxylate--amine ligase [Halorubellus sp. JP-L1]|uniref:carboxylate--amine ligase n=1 Tax=Halorubellus sp. JP-L1 TaxID=2715753 RepID=UPI00140882DA|nr:ATP-grasp domain-containing protein [Halorubellus sp. JP-L1]NHN40675.1 carboxylate--amine ligase [Halorubellus sp. JP-L1]